jgi:hypothetical protein
VFWIPSISFAGAFELLAWTSIVPFHDFWYFWPKFYYVLVVMVDAAIVAIAHDPGHAFVSRMCSKVST